MAGQFPHGNIKQQRNYVRTQSHMLRDMEQATSSSVRQIYQQKVLTASEDISQHATSVPRDMEQVLNCLKNVRTWQRLSRDALYNLHEIAYDTEFIHHITTFPDLLVIRTLKFFRTTPHSPLAISICLY